MGTKIADRENLKPEEKARDMQLPTERNEKISNQ